MIIITFSVDFEHFKKDPDDNNNQDTESEKQLPVLVAKEEDEHDVYDKLRVFSSLSQFQIKIFKGEPKLVHTIVNYNNNQCICGSKYLPTHVTQPLTSKRNL